MTRPAFSAPPELANADPNDPVTRMILRRLRETGSLPAGDDAQGNGNPPGENPNGSGNGNANNPDENPNGNPGGNPNGGNPNNPNRGEAVPNGTPNNSPNPNSNQ